MGWTWFLVLEVCATCGLVDDGLVRCVAGREISYQEPIHFVGNLLQHAFIVVAGTLFSV
jgi:hypothetical protein